MKEPVDCSGDLNYDFNSLHGILSIDSEELDCLKSDCSEAFTCRSIPDSNENYSSGSTYFIKADEEPRCFLEKLALSIFKFHTKDATFNHKLSGAEWWTQVIDCRDDVGFHWDRDYGLEEKRGEHVYPRLATVTYLTDSGGPTVILNRIGTENMKQCVSGKSDKMIVSRPIIGKHIKFDGRLLHAAPCDLLEVADDDNDPESTGDDDDNDEEDSDDDESNSSDVSSESEKESRLNADKEDASDNDDDDDINSPKRVTFLVNIWINHIPTQSKAFPAGRLKNMKSSMRPDTESLGSVLNAEHIHEEHVHDSNCGHSVTKHVHDSNCGHSVSEHVHDSECAHSVSEHVHDSECAHSVTEHVHEHVHEEHVHDSNCGHSVTKHVHDSNCGHSVSEHVHDSECGHNLIEPTEGDKMELYDCSDSRIILDRLSCVNIPCVPLETRSVTTSEIDELGVVEEYQERSWKFTSGRRKRYTVTIPLPSSDRFTASLQEHDAFLLSYTTSGRCITIESSGGDKRKAGVESKYETSAVPDIISNGLFELFDERSQKIAKISKLQS